MKVKVFFTVDVEVWCGSWDTLDTCFPEAYQRYIYGPTPCGNYGLPRILDQLEYHGLKGVFFTEPLFSARFGCAYLQETVGLIQGAGQEVQLHLHTEWASETSPPLLPGLTNRRQHLCYLDGADQTALIRIGRDLLGAAGATPINAFRAGSFGINPGTWKALHDLRIPFDSSYNGMWMPDFATRKSYGSMHQPRRIEGVWEYPLSLFIGASGRTRHAQLGACSYRELAWLLWQAAEQSWESVVILSHNFELLNQSKTRPDPIVDQRFQRLCTLLQRNDDVFDTVGFHDLKPRSKIDVGPPPRSTLNLTAERWLEQAWRRVYK
ncbi:MAG: polysaccharide deacetylase [Thiohalocapsa sp.]